MNKTVYRAIMILAVVAAAAIAVVAKQHKQAASSQPVAAGQPSAPQAPPTGQPAEAKPLPRVLDFGRGTCIPCKMMKPILDELAKQYEGRAVIKIIDISEHPDQAEAYRIQLIPTQVFIDAEGNEVFRHEGFMPKEDIVAKLAGMGVQ